MNFGCDIPFNIANTGTECDAYKDVMKRNAIVKVQLDQHPVAKPIDLSALKPVGMNVFRPGLKTTFSEFFNEWDHIDQAAFNNLKVPELIINHGGRGAGKTFARNVLQDHEYIAPPQYEKIREMVKFDADVEITGIQAGYDGTDFMNNKISIVIEGRRKVDKYAFNTTAPKFTTGFDHIPFDREAIRESMQKMHGTNNHSLDAMRYAMGNHFGFNEPVPALHTTARNKGQYYTEPIVPGFPLIKDFKLKEVSLLADGSHGIGFDYSHKNVYPKW